MDNAGQRTRAKPNSIRVSALVSVYNAESLLQGCLRSLVQQSLFRRGQLEIVVIDANSPQDEAGVVASFQQRYPRIKYARTTSRIGLYAAWNRAAALASGEYFAAASADDRFFGDGLQRLADALDANPQASIAYGDWRQIDLHELSQFDQDAETLGVAAQARPFSRARLLRCFFLGSQIMWRRSAHIDLGGFDESYRIAGDHDFALRATERSEAVYLGAAIGVASSHPGALSADGPATAAERQRVLDLHFDPQAIRRRYEADGFAGDLCVATADFMSRCLIERPPWRAGQPEMFLDSFDRARAFSDAHAAARSAAIQAAVAARDALCGNTVETVRAVALPLLKEANAASDDSNPCLAVDQYYEDYFGPDRLSALRRELDQRSDLPIKIWGASTKGALLRGWLRLRDRAAAGYVDSRAAGEFNGLRIESPDELFTRTASTTLVLVAMNPRSYPAVVGMADERDNQMLRFYYL